MRTATRTPAGTATDWHNAMLGHCAATQPAPAKPARKGPHGTLDYPLVQQMADTIAAHGWAWALAHYAKRLPADVGIVLLRSAARAARVQAA